MSTDPRRPIHPPEPPDLPDVARLQVQRADRSIRARGKWFVAFAVCVMGFSGWAWLWGFGLPASVVALACIGVPGALCWLAGIIYFGLPLVDEAARFGLFVWSAMQEVRLRRDVVNTAMDRADSHARYWYRHRPKERVFTIYAPPPGSRARVRPAETEDTSPEAESERDTRTLPELPPAPPPVAYWQTPAWQIVDAAANGQPISVRALTEGAGRCLSKGEHREATARLVGAGVLVEQGRGRPPVLAPAFRTLPPALCHQEVARVLGAPLSPTEE